MPHILRPDRWLKQPDVPVVLDENHWLFPFIRTAIAPTLLLDGLVPGVSVTRSTVPHAFAGSFHGPGLTQGGYDVTLGKPLGYTAPVFIFTLSTPLSTTGAKKPLCTIGMGLWWLEYKQGVATLELGLSDGESTQTTTSSFSAYTPYTLGGYHDGGTSPAYLWVNNSAPVSTVSFNRETSDISDVYVGKDQASTALDNNAVLPLCIVTEGLYVDTGLFRHLKSAPWQIFKPKRQVSYFQIPTVTPKYRRDAIPAPKHAAVVMLERSGDPSSGALELDTTNDLARGVVIFLTGRQGPTAMQGSVPLTTAYDGKLAHKFSTASSHKFTIPNSGVNTVPPNDFTVAVLGSIPPVVTDYVTFFGLGDSSFDDNHWLGVTKVPEWGGMLQLASTTNNTTYATSDYTSTPVPTNAPITVAGVLRGNSWRKCYLNGMEGQYDTTIKGVSSVDTVVFGAGLYAGTYGDYLEGNIELAVVWNRSLTDSEIAAWHSNPWQIFKPKNKTLYFDATPVKPKVGPAIILPDRWSKPPPGELTVKNHWIDRGIERLYVTTPDRWCHDQVSKYRTHGNVAETAPSAQRPIPYVDGIRSNFATSMMVYFYTPALAMPKSVIYKRNVFPGAGWVLDLPNSEYSTTTGWRLSGNTLTYYELGNDYAWITFPTNHKTAAWSASGLLGGKLKAWSDGSYYEEVTMGGTIPDNIYFQVVLGGSGDSDGINATANAGLAHLVWFNKVLEESELRVLSGDQIWGELIAPVTKKTYFIIPGTKHPITGSSG